MKLSKCNLHGKYTDGCSLVNNAIAQVRGLKG